jgi:Spy/CpxP family protein refolding chaperone
MKLVTKAALAVLPLALAAATMTLADSSGTPGAWQQRRLERLQSKLGLSDDQTSTIQSAFSADQDTRRQLHSQLRQAMSDLNQSALNGDDTSVVQGKNASAQQIFGQLLDLQAKRLAKIGAVLNPDQRKAFGEMKPGGSWHGGWKGNPPSVSSTPPEG